MIDALHIEANANVALVKYWGKADEAANLPATGSVSIGLDALKTTTIMKQGAGPNDEIWLNGESVGTGVDRIQSFIDRVRTMHDGIGPVHVISTNSFRSFVRTFCSHDTLSKLDKIHIPCSKIDILPLLCVAVLRRIVHLLGLDGRCGS